MPRQRPRLLRSALRFALATGFVWLLVVCALMTAVHLYGLAEQAQPADVIIVLGSSLRRDNQPGPALVRRSEHAAALYRDGIAPRLICTGGYTAGRTRSEADACRQVLEAQGVPRGSILLEERSRSTQENALFAQEIMDANGWRTAALVSDGYHLLRAQWIFSSQGIEVYPSPTSDRPRMSGYAQAVIREIAALHWQLLITMFNLPFTNFPP